MNKLNLNVVLKDKEISLRPFCSVNINPEHMAKIANDTDISKWIGHNMNYPYEIKDAKSFIKYAKEAWNSGEEYIFAILKKEIHIGNIGIQINETDEIVTNLGYWIGRDFWDNGYATKSVSLLTKFCFRKLKLRKIEASVYEGNFGSVKVLEKNGYKIEGNKRKNYLPNKESKPLDKILFGILNTKFNY